MHIHNASYRIAWITSPVSSSTPSNLLHSLLDIECFDALLAHSVAGESWEGLAIEQLIAAMPRWRPAFLRTGNGAEADLVMERGQRRLLFEIKLSKAPQPSRGFYELIDDLHPESATVIAPVDGPYEQRRGVWAMGLNDALARWGDGAASG
ncbi:DUF4143 domain-containing protein [Lamprocystis purpurea]|jgi:hypothetical protein|uniref:DUF4143 domain-containing protein n=1 Tax=Lamprocystis purpurea TaxID=61598 RepID=UPI00036607ED|nr:DUF4143 domain-containing protein [Lamprocystis purpurea]